jgi:hypothetical protein
MSAPRRHLAGPLLLVAGLALSGLAATAAALLAGYVALAAGAYLWARRREERRGAARAAGTALALAVVGEVLVLEALVDLAWLAGGASLGPMRGWAGEGAPAFLVPAGYGLALGFAAAGAAVPALALAAGGAVGVAKVLGPAGWTRAALVALGAAAVAFVVVRLRARRLARRPRTLAAGAARAHAGGGPLAHGGVAPRAHGGGGDLEHGGVATGAHARARAASPDGGPAAPARVARAGAALVRWRGGAAASAGKAEELLLAAAGSGALLLALIVVVVLLVGP